MPLLIGFENKISKIAAVYLGINQLNNDQLNRIIKWREPINLDGSIVNDAGHY